MRPRPRAATRAAAMRSRSGARPPGRLLGERAAGHGQRVAVEERARARAAPSGSRRPDGGPRRDARPRAARSRAAASSATARSKRSSVSGTPTRPASASRWTTAFVLPPSAIRSVIALSNASRGEDLRGAEPLARKLDRTRAGRLAPRGRAQRSSAGIDAVPGRHIPSASTIDVIVDAVPISLQWPTLGTLRRLELVELLLRSSARRAARRRSARGRSRRRARGRGTRPPRTGRR